MIVHRTRQENPSNNVCQIRSTLVQYSPNQDLILDSIAHTNVLVNIIDSMKISMLGNVKQAAKIFEQSLFNYIKIGSE